MVAMINTNQMVDLEREYLIDAGIRDMEREEWEREEWFRILQQEELEIRSRMIKFAPYERSTTGTTKLPRIISRLILSNNRATRGSHGFRNPARRNIHYRMSNGRNKSTSTSKDSKGRRNYAAIEEERISNREGRGEFPW